MSEEETETHKAPAEVITREFTVIIVEYITKVSSRYRANEFTSSQLSKTIMTTAGLARTRFPIIHRVVKEILKAWENRRLCTHVARTKYSRCRKTKDVYRFSGEGLREIKRQALEETIETIERRELRATPIMRTRESVIKDKLEKLVETIRISSPSEQ